MILAANRRVSRKAVFMRKKGPAIQAASLFVQFVQAHENPSILSVMAPPGGVVKARLNWGNVARRSGARLR